MKILDFHAEQVSQYGGITGGGLGKLMGAPNLSPLELVIREAVQNSWDARCHTQNHIEFKVEYKELKEEKLRSFRSLIYSKLTPTAPAAIMNLDAGTSQPVLIISDRKTRGLGGPTEAIENTEEARDFVNFVYMIGETKPSTDQQGSASGGSYGYGRSSFFRASKSKTIFVHSRAQVNGGLESRFIGISWQEKYSTSSGELFTGRHWWGTYRSDNSLGPVLGDDADEIARAMGMSIATGKESGTTIMILNPVAESYAPDERTDEPVLERLIAPEDQIISSILWNCWPRIIDQGIRFEVVWNGRHLEIPDHKALKRHPRLGAFVRAYDALRNAEKPSAMTDSFSIDMLRPKRHLGRLALAKRPFMKGGDSYNFSSPVSEDEPLQHIALMRDTRLILTYRRINVSPSDGEQYAGVFLTNREIEEIFQRSEPPSHDDWVPENLTTRDEKSHIKVTFARLDDQTRKFIAASPINIARSPTGSVAGLADQLAAALPGLETITKGRKDRTPATSSDRAAGEKKPKASLGVPTRVVGQNIIYQKIPFKIEHIAGTIGSSVSIQALILLAGGGKETKHIDDTSQPLFKQVFFGTYDPIDAEMNRSEIEFQVPLHVTEGLLVLEQPDDCIVAIDIKTEILSTKTEKEVL